MKELNSELRRVDLKLRGYFRDYLDTCYPSDPKVYQLVKCLQIEGPDVSELFFKNRIFEFYSLSKNNRTLENFEHIFRIKPYPWLIEQFSLSFQTIRHNDTKLFKIASNIFYMISPLFPALRSIADERTILLICNMLVKKNHFLPSRQKTLVDFLEAWRKMAFKTYGDRYEYYFKELIAQADFDYQVESIVNTNSTKPLPQVTQTDLDWMQKILDSLVKRSSYPEYPLKRGPKSTQMLQIEKIVRTLNRTTASETAKGKVEALERYLREVCTKYVHSFEKV